MYDDTTLLVGQHSSMDIIREYDNICAWSARNKLTINTDKTKEIIFIGLPLGVSIFCLLCLTLNELPKLHYLELTSPLLSQLLRIRKQGAAANKPAFIPFVTAQVARHGSWPYISYLLVLSCLRSHMHYQPLQDNLPSTTGTG